MLIRELATLRFLDEGAHVLLIGPPASARRCSQSGLARVIKDDVMIDVRTGDALLILKDETVELTNPHREPAELTVIATLHNSLRGRC